MSATLSDRLETVRARIEAALHEHLPEATGRLERLWEAMRYSTLAGGKRLRPALCVWSAEAVGGELERALPAACALELIHVYSLVHDDLPAMDDDDLRRGRPTNHKVYGDATAILVGDALQCLAFEVLACRYADDPRLGLDLVRLLTDASGARGMVGGQELDMSWGGVEGGDLAALEQVHRYKTGALLRASVWMGARVGGVEPGSPTWAALTRYAEALGLAFQVADDILDCTASSAVLGKTAGKDEEQGKLTYVAMLGLEGARAKARELRDVALEALSELGERAAPLADLARYVVDRGH